MENNNNRRLLIIIGLVIFFVIIVLVWYFFYAKPITAPSLNETYNPFLSERNSPRSQFIGREWNTGSSTSETEVIDPLSQPLIRIWGRPTSGQTFIVSQVLKEITATSSEGTSTILIKRTVRATSTTVLFVDKITGYVYGYPVETGGIFQISNSVLPGIHDAYIFNNGKRVLMRYLDQEKNVIVGIIATIPNNSNKDNPLPLENIEYLTGEVTSIAVNDNSSEASYVVTTDNGSTVYTVTTSGQPKFVASSPFREWTISYGGNSLYVTTKPSAYVEGGTFSVPSFQSELAEKTGLMTLPNSSGGFLSSMWGKQGLATFFYNNGDVRVVPFKTLSLKCAFGGEDLLVCAIPRKIPKTTEGLPDDWFQGRMFFEDDLFVIDKTSGDTYPLYTFSEKDGVFDITTIVISEKNDLFSFLKKQDESLWLLNTNLLEEN